MDEEVRSLADHWTDAEVPPNATLSKYGSGGSEFSGLLRWRDPDGWGKGLCTAYVVSGYVVRSDAALPASGDPVTVVKAKRAPDPALPFLIAVDGRGERRLRQYTVHLPIERVLNALTGTPFSGYVELSENVVSGNYYAVFHAGKPTCVGIRAAARSPDVGKTARQLMTDEVGIYSVYQVAVDPIDLNCLPADASVPSVEPGPPSDAPGGDETVVFDAGDADDGSGDTVVFSPGKGSSDDTRVFDAAGEQTVDAGPDGSPDAGADDATRGSASVGNDSSGRTEPTGGYCSQCGASLDADARYCSQCGTQLEE